MKTTYLYFAAAIAMLTACSSNEEYETVTNNGLQKVTFADPFVGKGLTRASGDITSGTDLQSYKVKVWGDLIGTYSTGGTAPDVKGSYTQHSTDAPFHNGDIITYNTTWSSTKEYYYPRDKYYYRFAAFAPADALTDTNPIAVSMNANYQTFSGASASDYGVSNVPLVQEIDNTADAKKGWDLLVSNRVLSSPQTDGITDRTAISFTFQHILSRLSFYVYTTEPAETTVKVKSIKAYLPNGATGQYRQNNATDHPTAETQDNNQTSTNEGNNYNSKNSTWKSAENDSWYWTTGFTDITDVVTPTDFNNNVVTPASNGTNTYQEYSVHTNDTGDEVKHSTSFSTAINDANITKIGNEYFLAPTPAYNDGTSDQIAKYHFFVKVEYSVKSNSVTKDYTGYINLYDADFYRFKQGWHHKLYLNLSSKKIRFITADVSDWAGDHKEDMTVSREVEGWTAEQH